jgi:ferredoxin
MGMLRDAFSGGTDELEDVVVVHSAPTERDVIFAGELRAMAAAGRIRLVEKHTDTDGMLSTEELLALVPDLAARQTWACGPAGMLDALEAHFEAAGIVDRLHTERFRPSVLVTGEGGTVRFTGADVTVDADGGTPILDAGEAAGVLMPSGCRMGICFGCVLPLRSGAVRDLRDGSVTTAALGDGVRIQTCVSAAAGACDIEL